MYELEFEAEGIAESVWQNVITKKDAKMQIFIIVLSNSTKQLTTN